MNQETAMATKPFRTSFLDGFTGEGIFGDLCLPGAPTRMFISEQEAEAEAVDRLAHAGPIFVLVAEAGMKADELTHIKAVVQTALNETTKGKVKVALPDAATGTERYAAS
jgi:hypothetical protein